MQLMERLRNWMRGPEPVAVTRAAPVAGSTSGRPTYAGLTGSTILPRDQSFQLLAQFRANVPVVKRATEILAGFVGVPELVVDGNDAATLWLHDWANDIEYGDGVGRGLAIWQNDLITQSLVFGFAVGEVQIGAARAGVERLWTYLSPSIGFKADAAGAVQVVQNTGFTGQKTLNPETICRVTHGPMGCNPNGESMLLALPLYCQTLLDIIAALRSTWRRSGTPNFHVNWNPPDTLDDPQQEIANQVRGYMETGWNEAMRSAVMDGIVKDFFSTGEVTVKVVGVEGEVMDVAIPTRTLLEQIISATGIPPFMFGLSWATTERMSKQQADMLMQTIACIRREVEGAIRKAVDLHVRLSGRRDALKWHCRWPDVSLQDQVETAKAELMDAQAAGIWLKFWEQMWRLGIVDQEMVAMEVADLETVATPMDEPPAATPEPQIAQPNTNANAFLLAASPLRPFSDWLTGETRARILAEADAEYPGLGRCAHNGKH